MKSSCRTNIAGQRHDAGRRHFRQLSAGNSPLDKRLDAGRPLGPEPLAKFPRRSAALVAVRAESRGQQADNTRPPAIEFGKNRQHVITQGPGRPPLISRCRAKTSSAPRTPCERDHTRLTVVRLPLNLPRYKLFHSERCSSTCPLSAETICTAAICSTGVEMLPAGFAVWPGSATQVAS